MLKLRLNFHHFIREHRGIFIVFVSSLLGQLFVLHLWVRDRGPRQTALALNCERLMQLRTRDRVPPPHVRLQDPHDDHDDQIPGSNNNHKEIDKKGTTKHYMTTAGY